MQPINSVIYNGDKSFLFFSFFFFPLSASELNLLGDLTLHLVNNCSIETTKCSNF